MGYVFRPFSKVERPSFIKWHQRNYTRNFKKMDPYTPNMDDGLKMESSAREMDHADGFLA